MAEYINGNSTNNLGKSDNTTTDQEWSSLQPLFPWCRVLAGGRSRFFDVDIYGIMKDKHDAKMIGDSYIFQSWDVNTAGEAEYPTNVVIRPINVNGIPFLKNSGCLYFADGLIIGKDTQDTINCVVTWVCDISVTVATGSFDVIGVCQVDAGADVVKQEPSIKMEGVGDYRQLTCVFFVNNWGGQNLLRLGLKSTSVSTVKLVVTSMSLNIKVVG